jgi:hypothetical protein
MPEAPPVFDGDCLTLDEYIADFDTRLWRLGPSGGWKLERQQEFRELDNASWDASEKGDWQRAVALLEADRDDIRQYQQKILDHGFEFRRVRIVEKPYSPYLIWELNSLMIRHQYGERIRVAPAESIRAFEKDQPLPEIVVLGTETVYRVNYDHNGIAVGANQSTDRRMVHSWLDFIRTLHVRSEALPDFFNREIADLRPVRSVWT